MKSSRIFKVRCGKRRLRFVFKAVVCTAVANCASAQFGADVGLQGRRLETNTARSHCGQVLDMITKEEVIAAVTNSLEYLDPLVSVYVENVLAPRIKFGFQSTKLCASCAEFQDKGIRASASGVVENSFADYCSPDAYGYNATVSGLLVLPFTNSSSDAMGIPPGPMKGAVWTHGTQSKTFEDAPSEFDWNENSGWFARIGYSFLAFPSVLNGTATIFPDFLGYAESYEFYKSYLVKRAYQTSTMPLWLKAKELVASKTNCESELVDVAIVSGYSEGGYAAIAVDAAMSNSGVKVLGTFAGAGPYRLSSTMLVEGFRLLDAGVYPPNGHYYLAMWGAAYSSTNSDLPNFGLGQNMISDVWLSPTNSSMNVVHWVNEGFSSKKINSLIPDDDPLALGNTDFVALVRQAAAENNSHPCVDYDVSLVGVIDKLCEAFIKNDLTDYLESVEHPIELCHSPEDESVTYENVRQMNLTANPFLSHLPVTGGHSEAFFPCTLSYVAYVLSEEYAAAPIEFSDACAPTNVGDATPADPIGSAAARGQRGAGVVRSVACAASVLLLASTRRM